MVWFHATRLTKAALLKRMPANDALLMWVDFAELRRTGFLQLLGGAKPAEDPEYRSFVYSTRFDYMTDLDSALVSFPRNGSVYVIVQGRFDWKSLRSYVAREHGQCVNSLCRMVGSTPDRHISFLPLRTDLMAMAVGPEAYAVDEIAAPPVKPYPQVPEGVVWVKFPGSMPRSWQNLPDGARPFARIVENAPSVMVSFVIEGDRLGANLEIECRSAQEASELATQFTSTTELARNLIAREHQTPNPADFSGILTSGVFRAEGSRVLGHWPIDRAFIRSLLGTQ